MSTYRVQPWSHEDEVWDLVHATKKKLVAAVKGKTEEGK